MIANLTRLVPNEHPDHRRWPSITGIAIIGEAPGEDEENYRRPFVGASGQFLTNIMRNEAGINRQACLDRQRLPASATARTKSAFSIGMALRSKTGLG